jgi:hypothetical protein
MDTQQIGGDINPATKKVEGDYGQKYTGCVSEKESLITPENGFRLIETLEAGMSPLSVVYQRDLEYEKLMNKSNEIQGRYYHNRPMLYN